MSGEPMPKPTVTIDTTNFSQAMRQLAKMTGFSRKLQEVIRSETRMIYQGALTKTGPKRSDSRRKIAEAHTINEEKTGSANKRLVKFLYLNGRKVRTKTIFKTGAWRDGETGGRYYDPDAPNPDWPLAQAKLKQLKALRQTRVGLAKWSWVRMAQTAGIKPLPRVPGYVHKAGASVLVGGQRYTGAFYSIATGDGRGFRVNLQHAAGNQFGARTRTAFIKAMNGRTAYFNRNLRTGVFEDANERTRRYGFLNSG